MARGMRPDDLLRIAFLSDPQIAPDGERIAYVVTTLSEERDEYLTNVFVIDRAGGDPRQLTRGPKRDRRPTWSPDGRQIAFHAHMASCAGEPAARNALCAIKVRDGAPRTIVTMPPHVDAGPGLTWFAKPRKR